MSTPEPYDARKGDGDPLHDPAAVGETERSGARRRRRRRPRVRRPSAPRRSAADLRYRRTHTSASPVRPLTAARR